MMTEGVVPYGFHLAHEIFIDNAVKWFGLSQ